MGFIYKIYNDINDKIYIGQTVQDLKQRWSGHKNSAFTSEAPLYRAIRKYGIDKFHIVIIEECLQSELNDKEKYYIKKYNTYVPNGYNATLGGDGVIKYSYEQLVKDYYELDENITKVCEKNNCCYAAVKNALNEYNIENHNSYDFLQTPIYECDVEHNILYTFKNVKEIAKKYPELCLIHQEISNYISGVFAGRSKSYYGHYFCYVADYDSFKKICLKDEKLKQVKCIETNMIFNSINDAARWIVQQGISKGKISGINSNIGRAIKRGICAYGYSWERIN